MRYLKQKNISAFQHDAITTIPLGFLFLYDTKITPTTLKVMGQSEKENEKRK